MVGTNRHQWKKELLADSSAVSNREPGFYVRYMFALVGPWAGAPLIKADAKKNADQR